MYPVIALCALTITLSDGFASVMRYYTAGRHVALFVGQHGYCCNCRHGQAMCEEHLSTLAEPLDIPKWENASQDGQENGSNWEGRNNIVSMRRREPSIRKNNNSVKETVYEELEVDGGKASLLRRNNVPSITSSLSLWDQRYGELAYFHSVHGHCNVPHDSRLKLSRWIMNQRYAYKSNKLSESRKQKLEQLCFIWHKNAPHIRLTWRDRFAQLQSYVQRHGHCFVSFKDDPRLYRWLSSQCRQYKQLRLGQPSSMTEKRIAALVSIGFELDREGSGNQKATWEDRVEQLRQYKSEHGDCMVPYSHPTLGRWVDTQRTAYRLLRKGKRSPLTDDRVKVLKSLGFVVDVRRSVWQKHFNELKIFLDDCHAECTPSDSLARWTAKQLKQYKLHQERKHSQLTLAQFGALESLRSLWVTNICFAKHLPSWSERLEQLKAYKKQHGDCNVPQTTGPLGHWVKYQRHQYRLLKHRKKSSMTKERLTALQALGFGWESERFSYARGYDGLRWSVTHKGSDTGGFLHDSTLRAMWRKRFSALKT